MKRIAGAHQYTPDNFIQDSIKKIKKTSINTPTHTTKSFKLHILELQKSILKKTPTPHIKNVISFIFNSTMSWQELIRRCNLAQTMIAQTTSALTTNLTTQISKHNAITIYGYRFELDCAIMATHQKNHHIELHILENPFTQLGQHYSKTFIPKAVPLQFHPPVALRQALKKTDAVFICADAITNKKIIAPIGSELLAGTAQQYNIPVFAITHSWHYHHYLDINELEKTKQYNHKTSNSFYHHSFEQINPSLITSIISDKGIYPPHILTEIMNQERKR